MTALKHTPGPWHWRRSMWAAGAAADGFGVYAGDRKRQICGNNQTDPGEGHEPFMVWAEMEANAALIAAAPDMLRELKAGADAADAVVAAWSSGDLAGAVNALEAWAEGAGLVIVAAEGLEAAAEGGWS